MGYDAFYQIISDLESDRDINTLEEFRDIIEDAINSVNSSKLKLNNKYDLTNWNIENNTKYHTNELFELYKLENKIWSGKIIFDDVYEYYDEIGNENSRSLTHLFDILMDPKLDKIFLAFKHKIAEKTSLEYVRLIDLNNELASDLTIYVDNCVVIQNKTNDLLEMGDSIALFHYNRNSGDIVEILNLANLGNLIRCDVNTISTLLEDYEKPKYLDESELCYRIKSITNIKGEIVSYNDESTRYIDLDLDDTSGQIYSATVELELKS
jgi:hypothetical protein